MYMYNKRGSLVVIFNRNVRTSSQHRTSYAAAEARKSFWKEFGTEAKVTEQQTHTFYNPCSAP